MTGAIPPEGRLFVLQGIPPALLTFAPDGSDAVTLIADVGGTPDGIQVDAVRGLIFWTNMGHDYAAPDGSIECCALDGSNLRMLVGGGAVVTPKQLKLDAARAWLYWCDREGMRVMRARVDGSEVTTLVRNGVYPDDQGDELRHCVGIALDEPNGHVYWTQKGPSDAGKGRIFRAGLDLPAGASPDDRPDIELIFDAMPEPIDLDIDHETGTLYWTDRGNLADGNTLNKASIGPAGGTDHVVLARGLDEGIGLSIDIRNRRAFVGDLGGTLRVADLDGGPFRTIAKAGGLTGLAFVQPKAG